MSGDFDRVDFSYKGRRWQIIGNLLMRYKSKPYWHLNLSQHPLWADISGKNEIHRAIHRHFILKTIRYD